MLQFRPVQSIGQIDANGMPAEQDKEVSPIPSLKNTGPFQAALSESLAPGNVRRRRRSCLYLHSA